MDSRMLRYIPRLVKYLKSWLIYLLCVLHLCSCTCKCVHLEARGWHGGLLPLPVTGNVLCSPDCSWILSPLCLLKAGIRSMSHHTQASKVLIVLIKHTWSVMNPMIEYACFQHWSTWAYGFRMLDKVANSSDGGLWGRYTAPSLLPFAGNKCRNFSP